MKGPYKKISFETNMIKGCLQKKKYYLDREIVPFSSDTPNIGPVSEHLDREYW